MEPFIGPVPVLHWMLNLAPEFPFVKREIKRVPTHILNMLDRARDKRPYDSNLSNDHNTRYHRKKPRDHHSLFVDPFLRHVTDQAYVLERGQELDVSKQVDALRFLLDVDRDGDENLREQKWESFDSVHRRNEGSDLEEDEEEELQSHVTPEKSSATTLVDHVTKEAGAAEATPRFRRLRSLVRKHARSRSRERKTGSTVVSEGLAGDPIESRDESVSRDEPVSRDESVARDESVSRDEPVDGGNASHGFDRFTWWPKEVEDSESRDQKGGEHIGSRDGNGGSESIKSRDRKGGSESSKSCDQNGPSESTKSHVENGSTGSSSKSRDKNGASESTKSRDNESNEKTSHDPPQTGFSTTFQHRFQNELNLIVEHPFAPSVFQATGTMFKLRSKGLVRQYLPNLPFRGSHFEQTKQSARAILLMDRCVDAKDRCLKINDFWGKYGLSTKDQVNFMYTTCFYELIREVAMNANRIISQLFETDETKVRRKYKRQRAHRLWEMGDWLVKRGAELAAKRGLHVTHDPSVKPDDVVSSIVAVVSYMEFVVINHRPYQTQTRINYNFVKDGVDGGRCHVTGDKSDPIHKAAASLWTPWAVASCNPLALADPEKAEEFSSFDFRYEDVFKRNKDECECGVALFQ